MPNKRSNTVTPRRRNLVRRRNKRANTDRAHTYKVHRRCAVYPQVTDASWLDKLSWYGSVALKLFKTIYGVGDDLETESAITSAGSSILLGPADFAASSVAASQVYTSTDGEVQACRALPYERGTLRKVSVRIVPSVDLGSRGGMYAAALIPIDTRDVGVIGAEFINRYEPDYDSLVKHPMARMSAVTKPITLTLSRNHPPTDLRAHWDGEALGYNNCYPQCVLMVAFSDLACKLDQVAGEYEPARSLFEVHLTGLIRLYEPGAIPGQSEKPDSKDSTCTLKLRTTDSKTVNVKFFDRSWDTTNGKINLCSIDQHCAERILVHCNRVDLLPKLRLMKLDTSLHTSMECVNMHEAS